MMDAFDGLSDVSRETLQRFEDLVLKWNAKINLIGRATVADIRERHTLDSIEICRSPPDKVETWADLGSGGGFPGIVISILRPDTHVTLIESDTRKATFLRTAKRELDLNLTVVTDRIEQADPIGADVVSARALAPLPLLLDYALRHGHFGTTFLFPKGETWQAEHEQALASWTYDMTALDPSKGSSGKILKIKNVRRRDD